MPTPEPKSTVTYLPATSEVLGGGWDVMQVVYKREDAGVMRIANFLVIARDAGGKIIRKTDTSLDRWEVVSDEETLRDFKHCFDERDRLAEEKAANMGKAKDPCKCGHPFSSHTRHIHETDTMRVDDALLPEKKYDVFSDRPAGESGCTECDCSQWKPAGY